jgi:hypothetical protein
MEKHILESLKLYLNFYKEQNVGPPLFVTITLLHFKGTRVPLSNEVNSYGGAYVADRDKLLLPEVLIQHLSSALPPQMRPAFNVLWQSANLPRSLNYDDSGDWDGKGFDRLKFLGDFI